MKGSTAAMPRKRKTSRLQPPVRIRDTSRTLPRVDARMVARALGADAAVLVPDGGSPFSLAAVRQELVRRLKSSGGRPALEGTVRRQKIPLSDEEWDRLEHLSSLFADSGVRATAGQVARILLSLILEKVMPDESRRSHRHA